MAYLLGSVLFSIVFAKVFNATDPRSEGSKNAGATNMLRVNSPYLAALTLIFDVLKGLVPVLVASFYGFDQFHMALVGFAAVLGHILPVFYKFRGGKGVATAIGMVLGVNYMVGLLLLLVWLLVFVVSRVSSLSALVGFFVATMFSFYSNAFATSILQLVVMIVIFITHRENIMNIYRGEERKSVMSGEK